jgi:hypothetical protein
VAVAAERDGYTRRERDLDVLRKQESRRAARDLEIPKCANPRRRRKAAKSLLYFGQAYFRKPPSKRYPGMPAWLPTPCADLHLEGVEALERIIRYGGNEAWAWPRGGGKDTWLRIGVIWAAVNGYKMHSVLAAFTADKSLRMLDNVKSQLEVNDHLAEDYPEVCVPIRALEGSPHRAKGQTVGGRLTRIIWGQDSIRLPAIPRPSGKAYPCSGAIISTGSINGAIRGIIIDGIRPDFVGLTDPQTDDVAKSPEQTKNTMRMIRQDFGGLGGHTEPLACIALVTVMRRNDVAARLTNRKLHPEWNGRLRRAFLSWPDRMDLWDQYEDLYRAGQESGEDPTGRKAHRFYLEHRAEMDVGAETYWPEAYIRQLAEDGSQIEVSAVQHLMNKRYQWGKEGFLAEFQNDPQSEHEEVYELSAESVARRCGPYEHRIVPDAAMKIGQGIDIGDRRMHWAVVAAMTGSPYYVVNYYWHEYRGEIDADLAGAAGARMEPLDKIILTALRRRREELAADWLSRPDGAPARVDLTLIDSGHRRDVVYRFIRESGTAFRAIKGRGSSQGQEKFRMPAPGETRQLGRNWYRELQREHGLHLYHLNADEWKHAVHDSLTQTVGGPGSLVLFRDTPAHHREFGEHLVSERWDPDAQKWVREHKHNHFWDCIYMAFAALDMLGVRRLPPDQPARPQPAPQRQTGRVGWINRGGGMMR